MSVLWSPVPVASLLVWFAVMIRCRRFQPMWKILFATFAALVMFVGMLLLVLPPGASP